MTSATAGSKVLAAVKDLLPGIAARADQAEADRRIPAETIAELKEAGVFRMLQPQRWGGLEATPVEFYEVIRTLAATCGAHLPAAFTTISVSIGPASVMTRAISRPADSSNPITRTPVRMRTPSARAASATAWVAPWGSR